MTPNWLPSRSGVRLWRSPSGGYLCRGGHTIPLVDRRGYTPHGAGVVEPNRLLVCFPAILSLRAVEVSGARTRPSVCLLRHWSLPCWGVASDPRCPDARDRTGLSGGLDRRPRFLRILRRLGIRARPSPGPTVAGSTASPTSDGPQASQLPFGVNLDDHDARS